MKAIWEFVISGLTLIGGAILAGAIVHTVVKCFMLGWGIL